MAFPNTLVSSHQAIPESTGTHQSSFPVRPVMQSNRPLPGRDTIQATQSVTQRTAPSTNQMPSPRLNQLPGVIAIYDEMGRDDPSPRSTAQAPYRAPVQADDSWRDRLYAERAANQRQTSSRSSAPTQRTIQPMQAIPTPDMPEYNAPGYTPPEEDPNAYGAARREAMAPGMRSLREGTREAISSAQSLDNPNARSKFIKDVLRGYGQGLESVSAGAGREARQVAGDARREQLDMYKIQHSIQSDTYLRNYQNQINKIAADFAQQQSVAMQNYNAQMNPNVTVAQSQSPAERSSMTAAQRGQALRQQFYPGV